MAKSLNGWKRSATRNMAENAERQTSNAQRRTQQNSIAEQKETKGTKAQLEFRLLRCLLLNPLESSESCRLVEG